MAGMRRQRGSGNYPVFFSCSRGKRGIFKSMRSNSVSCKIVPCLGINAKFYSLPVRTESRFHEPISGAIAKIPLRMFSPVKEKKYVRSV